MEDTGREDCNVRWEEALDRKHLHRDQRNPNGRMEPDKVHVAAVDSLHDDEGEDRKMEHGEDEAVRRRIHTILSRGQWEDACLGQL